MAKLIQLCLLVIRKEYSLRIAMAITFTWLCVLHLMSQTSIDSSLKKSTITILDTNILQKSNFSIDSYNHKLESIKIQSEFDSLINITTLARDSYGQFRIIKQQLYGKKSLKREWIYDRFGAFNLIRVDDFAPNLVIIKSIYFKPSGEKSSEVFYNERGDVTKRVRYVQDKSLIEFDK